MALIKIIVIMLTGFILINGCALANVGSAVQEEPTSKIAKKGSMEKDAGEVWTHFAQ